jgi:hypothetical protein
MQYANNIYNSRDFLEEGEYQSYGLENLKDFLDEMQVYERIERIRQINIPSLSNQNKPQDLALHQKLQQAYEKDVQMSRLIIHPLPENDGLNQFQYLPQQEIKFTSTTTSKVLASCWKIDDVRHDALVFPVYNTNTVPVPEEFPSVNLYNKRTSISFAADNNDLSPMVVTTPTIHGRKSNKKTASLPVLEETSTTRRSSLSSLSHQAPTIPSRAFANVSTQPLPGAFGSRKKTVSTSHKKKKPKTSGFK